MELVGRPLDPASISALAAIFGSLVGAFTAWIAQKHQKRRDLLATKIFHREHDGSAVM